MRCDVICHSNQRLVVIRVGVIFVKNTAGPFLCSGFVRGCVIISAIKENIKMCHISPNLVNQYIVDFHFRTTGWDVEQGNAQLNIVICHVILNDVQAR